MARKIPERLTLVDSSEDPLVTLVVDDGQRRIPGQEAQEPILFVQATASGKGGITVGLNEKQAKQLVARINKFFRENR